MFREEEKENFQRDTMPPLHRLFIARLQGYII
jgi:hypothetical protein